MFDTISRLPVIGFEAAREHRRLRALTDEAQQLLRDDRADAFAAVPSVSGWSPAQHFHHSHQILDVVLTFVRARCEDEIEGEPTGGPNLNGYIVLLSGRIPRGRAETPSAFTPPDAPTRADVASLLEATQDALAELAPHRARLDTLGGRRKHPRMGMLNPREWMRFAHVHTRHHQHIVREIVSSAHG